MSENEAFRFRIVGEFDRTAAGRFHDDMYVASSVTGGKFKKFGMVTARGCGCAAQHQKKAPN